MTGRTPPQGPTQPPETLPLDLQLLKAYLRSASKIAARLFWSHDRVAHLMPLDATKVDGLTEEDEERLDAYLLRFNSLTAMMQDHITRALLKAEEEDDTERSRKDRRLVLEKLGALNPKLDFGTLAELRNRLAHFYPDDSLKQASILNQVFDRTSDLLESFGDVLGYADRKFFGHQLNFDAAQIGLPGQKTP